MTPEAFESFCAFIKERESIRIKKERGDPWPWTEDPVLRAYRFCNVRREDDKETRLLFRNWYEPNGRKQDLWFACVVARLVNWWPSLEPIGYPVLKRGGWRKMDFIDVLRTRGAAGLKVFTGAYMVRADPHVSGLKSTYIAEKVLDPLWADRKELRPREGDTLSSFHTRLLDYKDMGPFIAGQIIADAKFFEPHLIRASDWASWATPGPGSLRGLARLEGLTYAHNWTRHADWYRAFGSAWLAYCRAGKKYLTLPDLKHAQNLQNCLCEYDKYQRVILGQGKPRSRYTYNQLPTPQLRS